ncbi:MAG TPA: ferritin [Candidatus Cloacimonas sp.]|nr:ferritin [Candidatus Cloacimonas sp.]HQO17885.1 ferritin [Candidatus Cloacimonas sp.]
MISQKMEIAINEQINKELYSEYLYLSMQAFFAAQNLDGFANWMDVQCKEEHFHAMKFFTYLIDRGGKVKLQAIAQPEVNFENPLTVFTAVLKHEQFVTQSINNLMDLAIQEKDFATKSLLDWYVNEQVEEEASAEKIVHRLSFIGNNPQAILALDSELGKRVFTPPVVTP